MMNNKFLLHSTGNYIKYPVISHNGKNMKKNVYMYNCGEGNGNPLQYSCLEKPRERGSWRAAVCGVAQSQTRLT